MTLDTEDLAAIVQAVKTAFPVPEDVTMELHEAGPLAVELTEQGQAQVKAAVMQAIQEGSAAVES